MIIILSDYDCGCTSQMMIGKKIYTNVNLAMILGAIEDRDVLGLVEELNKLLDANHVSRLSEDGSYTIYACDNGTVVKVMLIIDGTFQKTVDYSFISIYGKRTGREPYNGRKENSVHHNDI